MNAPTDDQRPSALPPAGGPLPTTRWSEVARAADADPDVKRAALGRLMVRYLPAFRAHLTRRRGLSDADADDVLQGFVCDHVVAAGLIARADRERGRLRGLLLTSLENHLAQVRRRGRAKKRSPGSPLLSLDGHAAPGGAADDVGPTDPPADGGGADVFELEWARRVLADAADRMRAECVDGDPARERIWRLFEARVLVPAYDGTDPPDYASVVRDLGFASPAQASNALVTGKRMFARLLRAVIGEYAADPAEVEAEMLDLWAIASAGARVRTTPEGRIP